jgi:hypothetical protein
MHHPNPRPFLLLAALAMLATVLLGGCAWIDWAREPLTTADIAAAQEAHAEAEQALVEIRDAAALALAEAKALAQRLDADQATTLIERVERDAARHIATGERAVAATGSALANVKDDGTPRWLAGLSVLLSIVAGVAGGRAASVARTLGSVVDGVQRARRALAPDQRGLVDESLLLSTDARDRARIAALKSARKLESVTA